MKNLLLVLAMAGIAGSASADLNLKLKSDQDLFSLCSSNTSPFWVGNNPSACCLVGDNLFVGGFAFSQTTAYLVKIETIYGTRGFRQVPGSVKTIPGNRGWTGMSFSKDMPGTVGNLVASFDSGTADDGSQLLYDVTTQANPILRKSSINSIRGNAGPCWDPGYLNSGFTTGTGTYAAVPGVLYFGAPGIVALDPATLDGGLGATVYEATGLNTGMGNTLWRSSDISSDGVYVVGRAANQTSVYTRTSDSTGGNITIGTANAAFINGQNVAIVEGLAGGTFMVLNDRSSSTVGQTFESVVKFYNMNGTLKTVNLQNADGSTFTAPPGNGYYHFSYDRVNKTLAILDFSARHCYIFSYCSADFNGDSSVDFFDYLDFVDAFSQNLATADFNNDGSIDFFDYLDFVDAFSVGC